MKSLLELVAEAQKNLDANAAHDEFIELIEAQVWDATQLPYCLQ